MNPFALYKIIYPIPQQPSQCSLTNAVSQTSGLGLFLLLVLVGCFCFKRWSRKPGEQQAIAPHQQQIERLERIWKITAHPER